MVIQAREEPPAFISLIPDEYVPTAVIEAAIERSVREYEDGELVDGRDAIIDFLRRPRPRIKGLRSGDDIGSCLAIQGPPGAGKTFTAKRVIAELLKTGARVGIVSNSHIAPFCFWNRYKHIRRFFTGF